MPNARPRSFGSLNVVVSSDSADGTRIAPNAPWQARAVISMTKLTEAPPTAETPAKPASPIRNVTLRPSRSASLPPSRSRLPKARVYAVTTHCRSTVEKRSACCAVGSAMFITVTSRTTMSCAMPITPRMSQRRRSAVSAEAVPARAGPSRPMWLTSDMRFTNLEVFSPFSITLARSGGLVSTFWEVSDAGARDRVRGRGHGAAAAAARRRAQPAADPRGGRGGLQPARARRQPGRDRPARRSRHRHRLPAVPDQGGTGRGAVHDAPGRGRGHRRPGLRGTRPVVRPGVLHGADGRDHGGRPRAAADPDVRHLRPGPGRGRPGAQRPAGRAAGGAGSGGRPAPERPAADGHRVHRLRADRGGAARTGRQPRYLAPVP